jgi:hypothetical protein
VYLRNRWPTKALSDKTPYEALKGTRPNVSHLRRIGSAAYDHVPKEFRRKLDSKVKKMVLIGYGTSTKGYRLYDPEKDQVVFSRNVCFDENKTGYIDGGDKQEDDAEFNDGIEISLDDGQNDADGPQPPGQEDEPGEESDDEQFEDATNQQPPQQRPVRDRRAPDRFGDWVVRATEEDDPITVEEALASLHSSKWKEAMMDEMNSLKENDVWYLTDLPKGRKLIKTKWVFKLKRDAQGKPVRYKARLVAKGFTQKKGLDYDETFSPVVRFETVRTLLALAPQLNLKVHQLDVKTAFLNGDVEEEVYIQQPEAFVKKGAETKVCRLKKSLYGLKQSPRKWNSTLSEYLKKMNFVQSINDPCLYVKKGKVPIYIVVYVDDMLVASADEQLLKKTKMTIANRFKIEDMGQIKHFLGVEIEHKAEEKKVWLGQKTMIQDLLERTKMNDCKPATTPTASGQKLEKAQDQEEEVQPTEYRSIVGTLMYLATRTRPDIAFATGAVARYCSKPNASHWVALKRILRYLKGTMMSGIQYSSSGKAKLIGYSDSDWAGSQDDRRSTSGYVFVLGGGPISWKSQKQRVVALSTAEAEYIALSAAAQEAVWLRRLLSDFGCDEQGPTLINEDNQPSMAMAKNPEHHGRAKHIAIRYHFIREKVEEGEVNLKYCPTEKMLADVFTKGLPEERFNKLNQGCGVVSRSNNEN